MYALSTDFSIIMTSDFISRICALLLLPFSLEFRFEIIDIDGGSHAYRAYIVKLDIYGFIQMRKTHTRKRKAMCEQKRAEPCEAEAGGQTYQCGRFNTHLSMC